MTGGFRKLSAFPRNRLLEEELVRCRASELDLLGALGAPSIETDADEPDPSFFWDVEWSCGLVMSLQFRQLTEVLSVRLDAPEVDHALRHLGCPLQDVWRLEEQAPERFRAVARFPDRSWELWAQGPDGRPAPVATGLTERDARCWCDEAERTGSPPQPSVRRAG
jgi:hypothetical protein